MDAGKIIEATAPHEGRQSYGGQLVLALCEILRDTPVEFTLDYLSSNMYIRVKL
jgi:hypothetical protein